MLSFLVGTGAGQETIYAEQSVHAPRLLQHYDR